MLEKWVSLISVWTTESGRPREGPIYPMWEARYICRGEINLDKRSVGDTYRIVLL
jgi:hypothetical protein